MRLTPKQFARILYESLEQTSPKDQETVLDNFVRVLSDNGALSFWPEIEREFSELQLERAGKISAEVTFSRDSSAERKVLDKLNNLVGSNAVLKKKISEEIIGGFIIETADERIDASIKNRLNNLKKTLSE